MRVDDAAEQAVADRQVQAAVFIAAPGVAFGAQARRCGRWPAAAITRAAGQAMDFAGGHQEGAVAVEADDFGLHRRAVVATDFEDRADRRADAGGLEHQPGHAHQRAGAGQRLAAPTA